MYDCGISCSVVAPEHQEMALLNTAALFGDFLDNLVVKSDIEFAARHEN